MAYRIFIRSLFSQRRTVGAVSLSCYFYIFINYVVDTTVLVLPLALPLHLISINLTISNMHLYIYVYAT